MCGGTRLGHGARRGAAGLSPRVRGNPPLAESQPACTGSIPACAGEPSRTRHPQTRDGVYPRVCGGTIEVQRGDVTYYGLSPRVRGNPTPLGPHRPHVRSIPACAGEPALADRRRFVSRVYPRVCGGTISHFHNPSESAGLSPRVRGNRHKRALHHVRRGSIPACAGEPCARARARLTMRVYPRVCGGTEQPSA